MLEKFEILNSEEHFSKLQPQIVQNANADLQLQLTQPNEIDGLLTQSKWSL